MPRASRASQDLVPFRAASNQHLFCDGWFSSGCSSKPSPHRLSSLLLAGEDRSGASTCTSSMSCLAWRPSPRSRRERCRSSADDPEGCRARMRISPTRAQVARSNVSKEGTSSYVATARHSTELSVPCVFVVGWDVCRDRRRLVRCVALRFDVRPSVRPPACHAFWLFGARGK